MEKRHDFTEVHGKIPTDFSGMRFHLVQLSVKVGTFA